ncbi:MAG: GNAT family N-acetyltransferase [Clostridium sp.]|nr:GNAT family N-acetyltransferase [Clostridium sp.]
MNIRTIQVSEVDMLFDLCVKIDNESSNMLFDKDERISLATQQKKGFTALLNDENSNIWIVEDDNTFIAYLICVGNNINRQKHSAYIVMGVLNEFSNRGIGTLLLTNLINWAKEKSLKRLELTVRSDNNAALSLYKKMGFSIEGTKYSSLLIDSEFIDEFYMSKIL